MKIRIEVDEKITEEDVIIKCQQLNSEVIQLQKLLEEAIVKSHQFVFFKGETEYYLENEDKVGEYHREIEESTENSVYCSNSFGTTTKYVNSKNLECSFGEMKVYFDNAVVQNKSVEICVDVSFGSVELYIPRE